MLRIDKRAGAASFLCLRNHLQRQGCFTRGLWTIDFNHAPLR